MATWGDRRKWLIEGVFGLIAIAIVAGVLIAVLYKAPSCTDGKQDQGEEGVDCGGPCPYLCAADVAQPIVRFVSAVSPEQGRTDVIAYIDNPNSTGGIAHARYTVELHDGDGNLIATRTGTINLPPSTTAPLYIPNAYDGGKTVAQTFLTLNPGSLSFLRSYGKPVVVLPSAIDIINQFTSQPRVTATLSNPIAYPLYEVTVVATVFDANGNAIAASQTVVPELQPQGSAPITFTWNAPFTATAARVEVLPATGS